MGNITKCSNNCMELSHIQRFSIFLTFSENMFLSIRLKLCTGESKIIWIIFSNELLDNCQNRYPIITKNKFHIDFDIFESKSIWDLFFEIIWISVLTCEFQLIFYSKVKTRTKGILLHDRKFTIKQLSNFELL